MTTISSVVLVDKRIQDYETIVSAVKADGVRAIVFDVGEIDTHCAAAEGSSSSFQYILNEIAALGATSFSNIGIVQHNTGAPFHRFFAETQGEVSTVAGVESADPTLQTWAGFAAFVTTLKNTYGVQNVDLMACALYSNPDWKYVIDTLAVQTGTTVRASTDDTGAAALGGDWFLESHTGVNLKDVYFTEAIENFRGVLVYSTKQDSSSLFSTKSMAVGKATAFGSSSYGGSINTITGGVITSDVVALYSNSEAFAALKTNGSVSTWGTSNSGGNQTVGGTSPSVASNLTSGVVEIFSTQYSMAALKSDGTVITWGHSSYGGVSPGGLSDVVDIYSGGDTFAALKSNGSLVTWGGGLGNSSTASPNLNSGIVSVNMTYMGTGNQSAAALNNNGRVITWPTTSPTGGNSSAVTSIISSDVMVLYTDNYIFSALKNDGTVISWGDTTYSSVGVGNYTGIPTLITNIVTITNSGSGVNAALTTSGSVRTWGVNAYGGNSTGTSLSSDVVKVYNNGWAFAALKFNGSVVTWGDSLYGGNSTSVASHLSSGVVAIYATYGAFAALKSNGRVITWGNSSRGASSNHLATDISAGIVGIYSTGWAFSALRNDGKLITWGNSDSFTSFSSSSSTDVSAGVVSVNNTIAAFAAITSTATTFDLSMSYYRDIDRYNILRDKENRRRANLTTLNNNVFTLSSARDVQKFNYTIPSGNSFRIIVPDYVSSNYSIISTISIPSPAAANYIIACEEGEPVTISGVTYINYGAFVYRRNLADNTFTKMTSAVIDGVTYKLYGGDGLFSSGIALQYRFGAFAVPEKTFGDASFNITAPLTDSSGAFTYTSSNTGVATVTSGGTVTIIKAGTTTITATQAASGRFSSDSITASLVVNKFVSTLGALTVPAKLAGEDPFTLTAPTSTISSIISPVNTITSTASMIPTPPDIRDISYGTVWVQRGQDIDGEANEDRSGSSVSMSADGTVVAIGAYSNGGSSLRAGHVRVYELSGNTWFQRGADIDGESADDWSGSYGAVSLSANGNIVAIGALYNDGSGNNSGHVRVYRYTPNKPNVTNQLDPSFGPVGWTRLGADIDGEAPLDKSGISVSLSADGTIVSIGAVSNNGLDSSGNSMLSSGHVRVYKYTPTKTLNVTNQTDLSFGPVGWTRMGADIDGEAAGDSSGYSNSLSADGTTVAIGAPYADISNNVNRGHVRVYRYNALKTTPQLTNQNISTYGPAGWDRLGSDIDGEAANDRSGFYSICLSANGNTVAIGSHLNLGPSSIGTDYYGSVRIYDLSGNTWVKRGQDIDGEAAGDRSGSSVSISADGNIVAIGAPFNDGTVANSNRGHVRIYFWNGIAWAQRGQDIDGEAADDTALGGVDGGGPPNSVSLSSNGTRIAIGASFNDGTVAGSNRGHVRVYDIATTNALTYSSSNSNIADVCGNLLIIKGVNGTSTITASQTGNTVTGRLDVSGTTYTLQYNPITYTIDSTSVGSVSTYGTVTLTGTVGTSTITATQPETLNYASRSVSATLDVSKLDSTLGALTVPAKLPGDAPFTLTTPTSTVSSILSPVNTITSTASVIPTPPDIRNISYGTTWNQLGLDISGTQLDERSGYSVSISADGTIVAIGSFTFNVTGSNEGRTRIYKYNGTSWRQLGSDISGTQADENSGYSVSLSADGTTVAIGSSGFNIPTGDEGRTRIYRYNGTSWVQLGLDISGNQVSENSGYSVSLSADGNTVAIGSYFYDKAGGSTNTNTQEGRTRIYRYNEISWIQLGLDISGNQVNEQSGTSVSLSADGTTVAIGSNIYDVSGNNNEGRTRIYRYNGISWVQQGLDISGNQADENSGISVSISADGNTVAIGSSGFNTTNNDVGRTRVFQFNGTSWIQLGLDILGNQVSENSGISVSLSADGTIVAIGSNTYDRAGGTTNTNTQEGRTRIYRYNGTSWIQLGLDISGDQANELSGWSVSLSSDGTTVAIGSYFYNTTITDVGRTRVYKIPTTNALTYSSNNSSIADVCGNLLLIKGVNGTSTITASQTGNTVTGRLDVSGTTYTLQYNPITYTIDSNSVGSVSTYGTVTLTKAVGTSTITATQPETLNYASKSVSATLDVSKIDSTLGALTVPAKLAGDAPFTLTTPTSTVSSILSPVNTITSTASMMPPPMDILDMSYGTTWLQRGADIVGNQADERSGTSVSMSADGMTVAIGSFTYNVTGSNEGRTRIYKYIGTSWRQFGSDILGIQADENSGYSVSLSADGNTVAIAYPGFNTTNVDVGRTRVYKYDGTSWVQLGLDISGNQATEHSGTSVSLSADGTIVAIGSPYYDRSGGTTNTLTSEGRTRVYKYDGTSWGQLGLDISGTQVDEQSGTSVSLSADGKTVAIGSHTYNVTGSNEGRTRIYRYNEISWVQQGLDISGTQVDEQSGYSVSLSADGNTVAIGSSGFNTIADVGRTRVFQFNGTSWGQLGLDILGNQTSEESGYSVSLSADGTTVAIGSAFYDAAGGTTNSNTSQGRTRIYNIASNSITHTSSNSSIADIFGNLLLIKGVDGTSTITASQSENTYTWRLDVSGTTYTLQYNPIAFTSSNTNVATVSTYGTVTLIGGGTSTITATQPETLNYVGKSVSAILDVSKIDSTLGALTVPVKFPSDAPFTLTTPTSTVSSILSPVNTITSTASLIPRPQELLNISYGTTWNQLGLDISGTQAQEYSGQSVSISADGTIVAIGSRFYDVAGTNAEGRTRVYKYNGTSWSQLGLDISGTQVDERSGTSVSLSANGMTVAIGSFTYNVTGSNEGRTRIYRYNGTSWIQLGLDISGTQADENSGYSVSLSADGNTVAIAYPGFNTTNVDVGRTRVYKYNGTSWIQLGLDISGNQATEHSGNSVSLSADGTIVAIGSPYYDRSGGTTNTLTSEGRTRVYKYDGTSWGQLGLDISGDQVDEQSGTSVSLSADGNTVAIGSYSYDIGAIFDAGRTRIYKYNGTSWIQLGLDISGSQAGEQSGRSLSLSADGTIVAIGSFNYDKDGWTTNTSTTEGRTRIYRYNGTSWGQLGLDILGDQAGEESGISVSLSSDGTTVAIGSYYYDKTTGSDTREGRTRIYKIPTTNALTYSSNNSSIADVCGNLLLIKGVNGTSTITASQTGNTVMGRLDVSGTTYTLQYNPITYTIDSNSVGSVSTYGTVTLTGTTIGTSTITATQPETLNYVGKSVTATLDVSGIVTVLGAFTIPAKILSDTSFNLTAPTTNNPSGAFTYTSSNTAVATVTSGGLVTIIGIGTTTITATQATSGIYTSASVSGSLVVNFGNTSTITRLLTDGASVIPTPVSNVATTYGSIWNQLGADIVGKVAGDESGTSISVSADGTIVAIGARSNTTNRGTVRVYRYNDVSWNQIGSDVNGEASSDYSGQSVSLSANGRVVAIGANTNDGSGNLLADSGHVRIYEFNGTTWVQRGGDIDGEAAADQSGISVSLSEDGNIVAIGAIMNDGSGNALSNSGHVRVYKYNASKTSPQLTNQSLSTFGPVGWDRLGADIDGEAVNDQSGFSVSLSADGATLAIGANFNDGTSGTSDTSNNRGHVRVYRYNASKTNPQLTDQTLTTFGPAGWDRMGSDIDGEVAADQSGFSVSLSADGSAVAIGSPLYDVSGVSNSGRVRVFAWNGTSWAQRGQNINGVNLSENVGDSVSLSADGSILSVSSFMKVVNYNYNSSTNTWSQIGANITGASTTANITNATLYSPHVYLDLTNPTSYNRSTNTWTNIGSLGGNVVMTNMGTFDASDNGGSFNFNGSTNRGQLNVSSTTLTSITYLAVVKTTRSNTGYATIIEFGVNTLLFNTYNNGLNLYPSNNSSTFSLAAGVWYVLAVTKTTGGSITGYVNGVSVFTDTYTGTSSTTNSIYGIGSGVGGDEYWNGKISAIAVYHNRVLTASEIANVSNTFQTYRVSLSSQGNIVAVGAREYDGTTGTSTNIGVARVYRIDTSGNYTFSSNNTAIADVCGNIILPKSAGSTTIAFTQSASGETASRSGTIAFSVSGITPTFGAFTIPAKNFGDAAFSLTAPTSDSSGAFTYDSSNTAVATVTSGGMVTIVGVGSTTITATQAESGNYAAGTITAVLVVAASLSNFSVPAKTYGDASFNLVDPDTTDNTVGFTFTISNTAVATLSGVEGRTVTITGAGSTVITATQAATASRGQLDISATLVVSQAQPVITIAPITKAYGNPSFRPVPTTTNTDTSGGSVFTFTSNNIAVVSMLDTSLVRINGVGTATLSITQAASANFTDASSSVVLTVNKGVSGLSASTFAVATNKTFGDAAFAITTIPISSSTGAITYSSSDEAVATVRSDGSGNSAITVVGQGTVTFTASQAESALYTADTKTSNTLTVARKTVALSRDTPSADTISKSYGDATFTVTATNESNGAFSFESSDPSFATIDASTGEVTIVAVGSTTLTATRAQTAQYNAASVSWTLNIARGTTALTGLSSLSRNVTVAPFSVSASSESDGAVSYALQDQSSTVLTIHPTSGLITLLSPGSAVIVASQAQGTLYEAPASITATITVSEAGNTLEGSTLTGSNNYANVDLSGGSLANSNITNTNFSSGRLDNSNFSGATISGANMSSCELSNASFNNSTVNNTNFTSGRLNNANMNGASITNSNMTSADLSDATMRGSTITGTDFTSAILRRTDLSGANVRGSIFNNADLSGAILARLDASGASFINANLAGANLSNADFTNANMTNANISGADITNVTFTVGQKLQLLKNRANRSRSEIQVSQVLGSVLLPILSAGSAVRDVPNVANATFKVMLPTTSLVSSDTILDIILDISNFAYFYFPIGENEYFQIQGVKYYISGSTVRNFATGASVENTSYGVKAIRLLAGSLTIIVNSQNTLSSSSFVVPSYKINTDAPFSPTTLPTSNSSAPIVYSSSNTSIATINSSSGVITPVSGASGYVRFTASQSATETHESASITSNELFVNRLIDFTLPGLNQTFTLSTMASLDASSINVESTDATAVFYVRLSDMTNLFQYQTDSFDVNNTDASDVKYYVFHRTMPTELHFNPSHAMMNKTESAGMLGGGVQEISADKSLVKHDFIRYIALRLFNTYHGVDLFQNENDLQENITYLGETVNHNIDTILSGISTTSASETMPYDASGNKYLTNDASGNMNLCRELMRQVAAAEPSRFYNNGADTAASGVRNVPLQVDDSINFKLTITAAPEQNIATGVTVIPSRTYLIKMVLKNTVNTSTNDTNTSPTDSEMYPNSYPYSTSVTTYAPTAESSSSVYNVYSPPAPIPTSRFGYNGWYYANTSAWVNIEPAVRDRVKWLLPSNAAGSSTVADLRYIRMNLKVYNKTSLPFIVVTTQAGSYRKYTISAPNSLTNGIVYSFYMNFNSYVREPATIGATNAALTYSGVSNGSFDNSEVIASIAVETDSAAATSSVEFTLSRVIVGEVSGEKAYGFSSNV